MKKLILILVFCASSFALDFEVKMATIDCYKTHSNIKELAQEGYVGLIGVGLGAVQNWDLTVKAINLLDNLRSLMMKDCAIPVQGAIIDASDSYDATVKLIGEMAKTSMLVED